MPAIYSLCAGRRSAITDHKTILAKPLRKVLRSNLDATTLPLFVVHSRGTNMSCERKHVLLTGTSSGIGKATLEAAVAEGFHVFAGDRSNSSARGGDIPDGETLTRIHLDITKADDIAAAVEMIDSHVGDAGLDGLANIAGIGIPGPLEIMPLSDLRASFEVDFFGQVALTQPLIPLVRRATKAGGAGRIVFIGSVVDRTTIPFFGALASSKSAIAAFSNTLRQELAPWGIDVVLVEPGFISTGADQATKARIDKLIADLSPAEDDLYGEMFRTSTARGYKTQTSGSAPEGVAEVIIEALTADKPKDHYLTGSKAHLVASVAKLPQRVQDQLKRKAFDFPKPRSKR